MRITYITLLATLIIACQKTEIPAGTFSNASVRIYGGDGSDQAVGLIATSDGGYLIGCSSTSYGRGDRDFLLIRTDDHGNKLWHKYYGGQQNDNMNDLCQAPDGSVYCAGLRSRVDNNSSQTKASTDIYVVRTNENGDGYFYKPIQFRTSARDQAMALYAESSGTVLVGGSLGNKQDAVLLRINADGDTLLTRNFRNSAGIRMGEYAAITQSSGFTYLLAESGNDTMVLLQLDGQLQIAGKRIIPIRSDPGSRRKLITAADGSMYLMVSAQLNNHPNIHVEKINGLGTPLWQTNIGDSNWTTGRSLRLDLDGNLLICGSSTPPGKGGTDGRKMLLCRINAATGEVLMNKTQGGEVFTDGIDLVQHERGKLVFLCNTARVNSSNLDVMFGTLNEEGNFISE